MTTLVTTGNLANSSASGLMYGMYPSGSLSQYLDSYSVFGDMSSLNGVYGTGLGYGGMYGAYGNSDYYNYMAANSDNMTALSFKSRSNGHALASYDEIIQKNMVEMATALREGEFGKASSIYDEIYSAISRNYGEELTTQADRVELDQSIKATITNLYGQVNGTSLVSDIETNGEGYFTNGFMQGLTLGNHHRNSAEETESYMTGAGIENYSGKTLQKTVGKIMGAAITGGAAVGIGALVAGPVGAIIGGAIAAGAWLFSNNSSTKVTKA